MSYEKIERPHWQAFMNHVSKVAAGRPARLEVIGLEFGDQIDADQLSLNGVTYEPGQDALYVWMSGRNNVHFDHVIPAPNEIYVELGERGLSELAVIDREGHKQFVHLRDPLQLPAQTTVSP